MDFNRTDTNPRFPTKTQNVAVNPIYRALFLGMTMKSWLNYSIRVAQKMKSAKENGIEYKPSDSEEEEHEYIESDEDSEEDSLASIENQSEGHEGEEGKENYEDEHISEEGSEAESEGAYSPSPTKNRQNQQEEAELEEEKEPASMDIPEKEGKDGDYKWVVNKELSPDYPASSRRDLIQASGKQIILSETPEKERRADSDFYVSPQKMSPMNFIKFVGGNLAESKGIFDFSEVEKLSNISPRSSVRDDFHHHAFDENMSQNFHSHDVSTSKSPLKQKASPLRQRASPLKYRIGSSDNNFLAPPLKKEFSGQLKVKSQLNKADTVESIDKIENNFLNIPVIARSSSNELSTIQQGKTTPKGVGNQLKNFEM